MPLAPAALTVELDDAEGERIAQSVVASLCASSPQYTLALAVRADAPVERVRAVILRLVQRGLVTESPICTAGTAVAWRLSPAVAQRLSRAARKTFRGKRAGEA